MLGVVQIHFTADPLRAAAICIFLLGFGFSLAMVCASWHIPDKGTRMLSSSGALFCLSSALGNMVRRNQHVGLHNPLLYILLTTLLAAFLLIAGFTVRHRQEGDDKIDN